MPLEVGRQYRISWDQVGDSLEEVFQTVVLSKRYFSHSVRDIVEITDFKFYLLKYLGSRRIILILFPYFSNRRTKLISMIKERFQ